MFPELVFVMVMFPELVFVMVMFFLSVICNGHVFPEWYLLWLCPLWILLILSRVKLHKC